MNTIDRGFRNFLIVVDKESLEVLAVWRGEQETEENRDVIEKKLDDRLGFLVREYCDSPDKKGRYDIVMARAKEFAELKNQLYELHGWETAERYLI